MSELPAVLQGRLCRELGLSRERGCPLRPQFSRKRFVSWPRHVLRLPRGQRCRLPLPVCVTRSCAHTLEEESVFNAIDFKNMTIWVDDMRFSDGRLIRATEIPSFICPGDENFRGAADTAPCNYVPPKGPTVHINNGGCSCPKALAFNQFQIPAPHPPSNYDNTTTTAGPLQSARRGPRADRDPRRPVEHDLLRGAAACLRCPPCPGLAAEQQRSGALHYARADQHQYLQHRSCRERLCQAL